MINGLRYIDFIKSNLWIIAAFIISIVFPGIVMLLFDEGFTLLWLIPLSAILLFLAIIAIDRFLLLIVFLVPLSIQLRFIVQDPQVDIFLPTELMLFGILIIMIFKISATKEINRKLLAHPVTIICLLMVSWSFITSLTGTMAVVSLKNSIMKLWFFTGFYLLSAEVFKNEKRIKHYFIAYLSGMIPVILYYLVRMLQVGIFNQKAAYTLILPFFNDHTSFGAALAFCITMLGYFIFNKETGKAQRVLFLILFILFLTAFIFSYSRAAWLSLVVAFVFSIIIILKIPGRLVFAICGTLLVFLLFSWNSITIKIYENRHESSGNIAIHLQSIANIRSDASNIERINRWNSALRMFSEKPLFGWGPATYQFQYAPFQLASEKTILSTNYGERGNVHSEYLGQLVDSGIPGLLLYLSLLFITFQRGIKILAGSKDRKSAFPVLILLAGLVTYVIHGIMNNFLDTDKISALFWGFIAALVATDIKIRERTVKHTNEDRQQ